VHRHIKIVALPVLFFGLLAGFLTGQHPSVSRGLNYQMASIPFIQWLHSDVSLIVIPEQKIAPTTPDGAETLNFSHEAFKLSTMAQPTDGVLLLPSTSTATTSLADVSKLFSDDVKVLKDEFGREYVAQVNKHGEVIRKIPFVVVPVSTRKTP
jgi:hypothetical protein